MEVLDYLLHIDLYLENFLITYQDWFYVILFALIFMETGLVIMPFLPGDSLLFAVGMLTASFPSLINIYVLLFILCCAAVLGDSANYAIGNTIGIRILKFKIKNKQIIKNEHISKTEEFYNKYGAKTIVIARFVPIVRTLAPFVAGVSKMKFKVFFKYNFVGGIIWVLGLTLLGYFLGTIPFVRDHFEIMVFVIMLFSLLPIVIQWLKNKKE